MNDELARKMRERGYSDGKVGHPPSALRGPYMQGYICGKSGNELDHEREERVAKLEYDRGMSDATNGHGPALLGGPYMEGYRNGCHSRGRTVGIKVTGQDEDEQIANLILKVQDLEEENVVLKKEIKGQDTATNSLRMKYVGARRRIDVLNEENKKLRAFIEDVVLTYDPRSDIYATELHGDAQEALGRCRCCGQEVCDEQVQPD